MMRFMTAPTSPKSRAPYPGILLIAAATLVLEIAWMRVLSVTLWYHFAFMVLSTALFGIGFAGVLLSLRRQADHISDRLLGGVALGTPVAFVAGYALSNLIPFEPFSLMQNPLQWVYLPLYTAAVTLPFFFSGLTIAALVTRYAGAVHRLYLFDLLGAGLGAMLVVFLIPRLGGSGTVLVSSGTAAVGAALIVWRQAPKWRIFAMLLAVVLIVAAYFGERAVPVRISSNKVTGDGVPLARVFSDERFHRLTAWNTTARVDVVEWRDRRHRINRTIFIDGGTAVTRLAHPVAPVSEAHPGKDDESFFFQRFSRPKVLVVGSGGGREVLLALRSGASSVTAVELNPDINRIVCDEMADFTGHLCDDPRVRVLTDEARSFLGRTTDVYDIIHCPHTISNAALASGSLSLAENYLLTIEAFREYTGHLHDRGILLITRPEAHLARLLATARASYGGDSPDALAHRVMIWRRPSAKLSFYGGFAFRRTPFTETEVERFRAKLAKRGLEPLYLPGAVAEEPYASLTAGAPLDAVPMDTPAILTPATDDKPFFNRRVPLSRVRLSDVAAIFTSGETGRSSLEDRPVTEAALLLLLVETVLVALCFIIGPLFLFRRRAVTAPGTARTLIVFLGLGLAYISVEMGLIQKLTLFLGKPVVVFSTVLGTLLISSGLGSAFAARFSSPKAPRNAALAAALVCTVSAVLVPLVTRATLPWAAPLRMVVAIVLVAAPGFVMGMPFPLFLRQLKRNAPFRIPWAFGINGVASVIGTIGAVLAAMGLGHTAVILIGVASYLAVAAAAHLGSTDPSPTA